MKVTRAVGRVFKPLVNFPRWMGLSQIWRQGQGIYRMIQDMRRPEQPIVRETFEEALKRLNISESDLKERMKFTYRFALIYTFFGLIFLAYTIYMIFHGLLGSILGLLITALLFTFAYREHFWYYQMKVRRLGCSFREWLNYLVRGTRHDNKNN
jgi:intracellular multiplication protein IcmV